MARCSSLWRPGQQVFLVSMALLLWLGLAAGIERFQIEFYTAWKQPMSRLEILQILADRFANLPLDAIAHHE
jgi:hypothetical protein